MKHLLVTAVVALLGVMGSVQAQSKVNEAALMAKIEKAKADSQDPKKGAKAAAWINLGNAYFEAATTATTGLFSGLDEMAMGLLLGKATTEPETVGGVEYQKATYPYYDVYLKDGAVAFWKETKQIAPTGLADATAAYEKALEIDPSAANSKRVAVLMQAVQNSYKQTAANAYGMQSVLEAAQAFGAAYDISVMPVINAMDTVSCYNAGMLFTVAKDFAKSQKYLEQALAQGYEAGGDVYYYLYHTYYGLDQKEKSKEALLTAVGKFPKNNRIIEGLIALYASTGEDPKEIIPVVEKAIASDPKNPELYAGLGRIYDKLGDVDKSVESFQKAADLTPDDFAANFNVGLLVIKQGDASATTLRDKPFTSQEEFNADLAKVNAIYAKALLSLEKAHVANPKDVGTVELLKNVYFRLRDEAPAMMDNYTKYNTLFKQMQE